MKMQNRFDSTYRYNPLDPRNWTLICKTTVILTSLLIIDWIIGISMGLKPLKLSYFANAFPEIDFFNLTFPLIIYIVILIISPKLNDEMEGFPFLGAIMIKILLNLGSSYFTLLGQISQSILNISCSILIVVVLVFVIFFETEGPEYYIKAMLIGVILLSINQIINLIIFGWKLEQLWGISLILISIISVFLIQKEKLLFGVLPILVMIIFNNYILPFGLGGFGVGSELLKFTSILLLIKWIGNR